MVNRPRAVADRPRVGILALQGAVREHARVLSRLGAEPVPIKDSERLATVDGLIIPGGESTTIGKLMAATGLLGAVSAAVRGGLPVFGTCAGLILMAERGGKSDEYRLGLLDISIKRNAYGRQFDSFETGLRADLNGEVALDGVFIRAPLIEAVGPGVKVLAQVSGAPVLVEEGPFLGSSFHPELAGEDAVHRYFLTKLTGEGRIVEGEEAV